MSDTNRKEGDPVLCHKGQAAEVPMMTYSDSKAPCYSNNPEDEWELDPKNDSCYLYIHSYKSWQDAESFCQSKGGHLTSIHDEMENYFISTFFTDFWFGKDELWMGLTTLYTQQYDWSDGSETGFHYWDAGEPEYDSELEQCVLIDSLSYRWSSHDW